MNRGDIYTVSLDPTVSHEQQGPRPHSQSPVLIISPTAFNRATRLPVVLPITTGGEFARRLGFAVALTDTRTTGIVRCDQPRVLDIEARHGKKVESLPTELLEEVLAKTITIFQ